MRIGIDISQVVYEKTGVANYLSNLVENLINLDKKNTYILFFSSLRRRVPKHIVSLAAKNPRVQIRRFTYPPLALDLLWNRLHILTLENFVGDVEIFLTSDWTEPPARNAKKATIIYDLTVYTNPEETNKKIIETQKRKLSWVKKESDIVFCISESTKKDIEKILEIPGEKIKVIYPGLGAQLWS